MFKDPQKRNKINFYTDLWLILPSFGLLFSGIIIEFFYHFKRFESLVPIVGLNRSEWLLFHKITVIIIIPLMVIHLTMHYKWLIGVIKKRLYLKGNKQVKRTFRLFIIFILTALTGLIPWIFGFNSEARFMMVEIHDKLAIFYICYFLYHFAVRHNWIADYMHNKQKQKEFKAESESQEA